MRDDTELLRDIGGAIEGIDRYADRGKEAYEADELLRAFMAQQVQVIGEAASRLSTGFRSTHGEVRWRGIIAMRNVLVHGYFGVDEDIIWNVIANDVPVLKQHVLRMLSETDG